MWPPGDEVCRLALTLSFHKHKYSGVELNYTLKGKRTRRSVWLERKAMWD